MKVIGTFLVILGLVGIVSSLNMDTTVPTGGDHVGEGRFSTYIPPSRVHNIGLMEERRIYIILSSLAVVVGVILIGFGTLADSRNQAVDAKTPNATHQRSILTDRPPDDDERKKRWRQQDEEFARQTEQRRQAETRERRERARRRLEAVSRSLRRMPGLADRYLRAVIGADNDLVYRFAQALVYVALPIVLVILLIWWRRQ